jgi:hypothetical protein
VNKITAMISGLRISKKMNITAPASKNIRFKV